MSYVVHVVGGGVDFYFCQTAVITLRSAGNGCPNRIGVSRGRSSERVVLEL